MGTKHISHSQLSMYEKCPRQWAFRYVEGIIRPPGIAAHSGRGVHRAREINLRSKVQNDGEMLSEEETAQVAADEVRAAVDEIGLMLESEEDREKGPKKVIGEGIDKAVRLSTFDLAECLPAIEPLVIDGTPRIEYKFELEAPDLGVDIVGFIDLQRVEDGRVIVTDTKTKAKSPSAGEADESQQLTLYAMAVEVIDGAMPDAVELDFLVDTKTPKNVTQTSTRDDTDAEILWARMVATLNAMKAGHDGPAPTGSWWCSEKWCGYHDLCPFVRSGKR